MAIVRARTKYNTNKEKLYSKFKYKSTEGTEGKLSKLAKSNPRTFWKILKFKIKKKENNNNDIWKADDFYNNFKNVYDHSNPNNSENV